MENIDGNTNGKPALPVISGSPQQEVQQVDRISKEDAAKRLDVSEKRVRQLAAQGEIDAEYVGGGREGRITSISAASVEAYAHRVKTRDIGAKISNQLAHMSKIKIAPAVVEVSASGWLTIDEAAAYTRFREAYLIDLILAGDLRARRADGSAPSRRTELWLVHRKDLDAIEGIAFGEATETSAAAAG